jgi:plasmanylethanolamine desaturase
MAWLEGLAVAVCGGLLVALASRLVGSRFDAIAMGVVLIAAGAGYLAADLGSGVVHWFCDRFFEEDTRLVGRVLIQPFREHHRDPRAMTHHGFLELTGNSCLAAGPVLGAAWACGPAASARVALGADAFVLAFALAAIATNHIHKWAHTAAPPPAVAWLQRRRLVLTPAAHDVHHRPGHTGAYCVTTGWVNAFTDGLGVFRGLERALAALGVPRTVTG